MRSIQLRLPVSVAKPLKSKEEAQARRKHKMIDGRPRRLQVDCAPISDSDWREIGQMVSRGIPKHEAMKQFMQEAKVIKVAILPRNIQIIDRIRELMSATRPEAIRTAVISYVDQHKDAIDTPPEKEKRVSVKGRCCYVKIPFPQQMLDTIGHQDKKLDDGSVEPAYGLCKAFNCTRQQLINRAVKWYLAEQLK